MGFLDGFTSDGTVEMKHTEYYNLMREAAKADLITNAVKAEVPGFYIQAMITGEKPDFLNELEAEEEDTGFHSEYEQITGAVVSIFEAWMKENGVESAAASLHRLIDTLAQNRIKELRTIKENQEESREKAKASLEELKKTIEAWGKMPSINVCMDFGSKKDHTEADGQKPQTKPDRDCWSCETCFHRYEKNTFPQCKSLVCDKCEDGSQYINGKHTCWTCGNFHKQDTENGIEICRQCRNASNYISHDENSAEDDAEGQQDQEESEEPDNGND